MAMTVTPPMFDVFYCTLCFVLFLFIYVSLSNVLFGFVGVVCIKIMFNKNCKSLKKGQMTIIQY